MKWIFFFLLLFVFACSQSDVPAKASFVIEPDSLVLESGNISDEVTITVTKQDKGVGPVQFDIVLNSPNANMVDFFDEAGNPITSIQTGVFTHKGDRLSSVFKVRGLKALGSDSTSWKVLVSLFQNGTEMDTGYLKIKAE